MFFDDPVPAFGTLRHAARDGAELRFFAWRGAAENPFMTTAERAAAPFLPNIPARHPGAPGQFAFADRHRIHRSREESGGAAIEIRPSDIACSLREGEVVDYFTRFGPLGRARDEADERKPEQVKKKVRADLAPFAQGAEERVTR